jgi:hypothetical protein
VVRPVEPPAATNLDLQQQNKPDDCGKTGLFEKRQNEPDDAST